MTTIIAGIEKAIEYNRANRDYDISIIIDGGEPQYIGSASTYGQAEIAANAYAYDYLMDSNTIETAAELVMQAAPPANWPRELSTGKPMDWYAAKAVEERGVRL